MLVQGSAGSGGAAGIRTPDLRRAKAALSQLSYGPRCGVGVSPPPLPGGRARTRTWDLGLIRAALSPPELRARPRPPRAARPQVPDPAAHPGRSPNPGVEDEAGSESMSPPSPPGVRRAAPGAGIDLVRRASSGPRALLPDRPPGDVPRSRSRSLVPRRPASSARRLTWDVSGASCAPVPRKEVIQPQLPLRLPCYDFVPITSPTLDGCALAVRPPASGVAGFRDVTGGVYKAREHIHRSSADLRLLATPPSRGRVAAPDPN